MNYSKHQILAFAGLRDKYVKVLAVIGEDVVTEDSHAMVTLDKDNLVEVVGSNCPRVGLFVCNRCGYRVCPSCFGKHDGPYSHGGYK